VVNLKDKSDQELNELVATQIMGWTAERVNEPDHCDPVSLLVYGGREFDNYVDKNGVGQYEKDRWLPTTEFECTRMVIEKLWYTFHGNGGPRYECHIHLDENGWTCDVLMEGTNFVMATSVSYSPTRAVCEAALGATQDAN
jgi:hypothetical protein